MKSRTAERICAILLVWVLAAVPAGCRTALDSVISLPSPAQTAPVTSSPAAETTPSPAAETAPEIAARIVRIKKYGNLVLSLSPETMLGLGFEPADVVRVRLGERTVEMPVGTSYSDVNAGEPICCLREDEGEAPEVVLAVNLGDFATSAGVAVKKSITEEPGYVWEWCEGFGDDTEVSITLAEKQGYADEYLMRKLTQSRSNERTDYPQLTDAQYANFREIETTGMGAGTLYRSSSPINPKLGRSREADAAMEAAGIRAVVNMADSAEEMQAYDGFSTSYYATCNVTELNMGIDYFSEGFRSSLAAGLRFLASRGGPYLIHCTEGKDRTGFAAAVLECLMGASPEEVVADYMRTYENYYGLEPGSEQYARIAQRNIEQTMARAFELESFRAQGVDLAECAERYLEGLGLTAEEIDALKARLGADHGGL